MNDDLDGIVNDYFRRLSLALRDVARQRRDQLIEELKEHVTEARAALVSPSAADLREILERIGEPDEIAAEELGQESGIDPKVRRLRRLTKSWSEVSRERRSAAVGVTAGLFFAVSYLLSLLLAPTAPDLTSSASTISTYYWTNAHVLLVSAILGAVGAVALLLHISTLHRETSKNSDGDSAFLLTTGTAFVVVAALGSICTSAMAILGAQSLIGVQNLQSPSYLPIIFTLRVVIGSGMGGLFSGFFVLAMGRAIGRLGFHRSWFATAVFVVALCNIAAGVASFALGSPSTIWSIVKGLGIAGFVGVVLVSSLVLLAAVLPEHSPSTTGLKKALWQRIALPDFLGVRPAVLLFGAMIIVASIAVPTAFRGGNAGLITTTAATSGGSLNGPGISAVSGVSSADNSSNSSSGANSTQSPSDASVGYDGAAICAPTTDAATSGGSPSALESSATEVASGTIEGEPWSLWSSRGQTGAAGLENGGVVFDGNEYGLCAGYPNPSETEMIDTGGPAIIYGVVNYPGLASVQISTGTMGSFAVGTVLATPQATVVNGVSFYITTLPDSACSYSYLEVNTTSPSYSAEHGIGFGGDGAGEGYSITNNPGNTGACTTGQLDPLSYSHGVWQIPPGQFSTNG